MSVSHVGFVVSFLLLVFSMMMIFVGYPFVALIAAIIGCLTALVTLIYVLMREP